MYQRLTWKQADHSAVPHENWLSPTKIKNGHGEVPSTDGFIKNDINHPQYTCILPIKWRLEITNRLGGVRQQRICSDPPPRAGP